MQKYEEEPEEQEQTTTIALSRERWYVLFVLSFQAHNQCLLWFTFSSMDLTKLGCDDAQQQCASSGYYGRHFSVSRADLLLNWGSIFGMICTPLAMWLLRTRKSPRSGSRQWSHRRKRTEQRQW